MLLWLNVLLKGKKSRVRYSILDVVLELGRTEVDVVNFVMFIYSLRYCIMLCCVCVVFE